MQPSLPTVHLRQHLVDDAVCDARAIVSTLWSDRVKLIKEQNAWLGRFGTFKQVAHRLFARTDILVQDFRALDADKVEAAFFCDSAG